MSKEAQSCAKKALRLDNAPYLVILFNLKFDTKLNGKPVKSRLPVFCLHVVYLPDLAQEKIFLIF